MGSYSEVGLCFPKATHNEFLSRVEATTGELKEALETLINEAYVHTLEDESEVLYHWEYTKWYIQYPEVEFISNFLSEIDKGLNPNCTYKMIIVGEERGDIEDYGEYEDDGFCLSWNQNVSVDPPSTATTREPIICNQ